MKFAVNLIPKSVTLRHYDAFPTYVTLQDHASRYNDHLQRHVSLRELMRELNDMLLESHDFSQTLLLDQCKHSLILRGKRYFSLLCIVYI